MMNRQPIVTALVAVLLSVMVPGVINRVRALLSGRKGIRMFQHVSDMRVQLRKGAVYSPVTTVVFRIAPLVYTAAAFTALLFIPVGDLKPLLSFNGDVVMVAYLMALCRIVLVLAAMDTGSSFEGMGASREALYGAMAEPALFIVAATMALVSGHTSFDSIFTNADIAIRLLIVPVLLTYVLIKLLTVEAGRVPVDDPRTHLELTMIHEVMILDYAGVDLALISVGSWLRSGVMALLAANALAVALPYNWWVVSLLTLGVGVFIGVAESFQARNRLSRNSTYILTITAMAVVVFFVAYVILKNLVVEL